MNLVPLSECSRQVTSTVTGNGRLGVVTLLAPHLSPHGVLRRLVMCPCQPQVVLAVRRLSGKDCPGGFSLLLPTQRALLAHHELRASWGGSGAMGIQHGADELSWLWGCVGQTAPGEAHPPQGRSWVFLQMRTKQVMLDSRQHVRPQWSQQWGEADWEGAWLRHHRAEVEASSGLPSLHDRGVLWRHPLQRWQHRGPNTMPSPQRHPSGETTDYRWCLISHKTASGASGCADTQASHRSPVGPGPIGCPHLHRGAPSCNGPQGMAQVQYPDSA